MADTLFSLPETPEDWRVLLTEQRESGLSARACCATRGIPCHRFIYRRRMLGTGSGAGASGLVASHKGDLPDRKTEAPTLSRDRHPEAARPRPGLGTGTPVKNGLA